MRQSDISKPFVLKTDASVYALTACLLEGKEIDEHLVEYTSCLLLLSAVEKNYNIVECETLVIIYAIDKFYGYIENSPVIIRTDHQPLKWLMSLRSPNRKSGTMGSRNPGL